MVAPASASLTAVRRLAIARQRLAGPRPRSASADAIVGLVGELGYVQWDPVTTVAPSHLLSLWARVGAFRPALLERLLWEEKRLFEHWTPIASLVRTEDYPLFASLMARYPRSLSPSWGSQRDRAATFLAARRRLRRNVLRELRGGPRVLSEFSDHARTQRDEGEWTPASDVAGLLFHLTMTGEVMVVGHRGNQNLWGLTDDFLPASVERRGLSAVRFERAAARRALHALGAATPREITMYFVRGRYERLNATLAWLERAGEVGRVRVVGAPRAEERFILTEDLSELARMETDEFPARLSLIPPFDNLVGSSARAERLFGFSYVREQFLPPEKRRYGTYVLPIVYGERFIGRIDPRLEKGTRTLVVQAVHAEPDAPLTRAVGEALGAEIDRLAELVGAERLRYPVKVPAAWRPGLRG